MASSRHFKIKWQRHSYWFFLCNVDYNIDNRIAAWEYVLSRQTLDTNSLFLKLCIQRFYALSSLFLTALVKAGASYSEAKR